MILQILILIVGFIILIKGADLFVDGASNAAMHFKMPKILIGLTIVAFGTSAPELAVSIKSISLSNHDIVLGNVIGSNIMNILLILGCCSLVHPLIIKEKTAKSELPFLVFLTTIFAFLLSDSLFGGKMNNFTRFDGTILLIIFLFFIYNLIKTSLNKKNIKEKDNPQMSLKKALFFIVLGILMIVYGSDFIVKSASTLAGLFGVSNKMIALTVVAFGTSLPELITSLTATRKKEYDLAIGNVIGSNIFNIGLVVGFPVMIFGGSNSINFNYIDILVMLISTVVLFLFSVRKYKITKLEGFIFLLIFAVYYGYVIVIG